MSMEVTGMRDLSVEELSLVSGGGTTPIPHPLPPGVVPSPAAFNDILNSMTAEGDFLHVTTSYGATPYVVSGPDGAQWCWDNPEDMGGETICMNPGVIVNGERP
jgi:hypothetical protein